MGRRIASALGAAAGLTAALWFGCSGPYSGKPERLAQPKEKAPPPPPDAGPAGATPVAEAPPDACRTNFFADPVPIEKRDAKKGMQLAGQADGVLLEAEQLSDPLKTQKAVDAIATLKNALKADPYGPEPTYKMAVAYALVGKQKCALALLERLAELKKVPELTKEVERVIKRAARDTAFEKFRKEANGVLGEG
jgi:hypothetical protein